MDVGPTMPALARAMHSGTAAARMISSRRASNAPGARDEQDESAVERDPGELTGADRRRGRCRRRGRLRDASARRWWSRAHRRSPDGVPTTAWGRAAPSGGSSRSSRRGEVLGRVPRLRGGGRGPERSRTAGANAASGDVGRSARTASWASSRPVVVALISARDEPSACRRLTLTIWWRWRVCPRGAVDEFGGVDYLLGAVPAHHPLVGHGGDPARPRLRRVLRQRRRCGRDQLVERVPHGRVDPRPAVSLAGLPSRVSARVPSSVVRPAAVIPLRGLSGAHLGVLRRHAGDPSADSVAYRVTVRYPRKFPDRPASTASERAGGSAFPSQPSSYLGSDHDVTLFADGQQRAVARR